MDKRTTFIWYNSQDPEKRGKIRNALLSLLVGTEGDHECTLEEWVDSQLDRYPEVFRAYADIFYDDEGERQYILNLASTSIAWDVDDGEDPEGNYEEICRECDPDVIEIA